MSLKNNDLRRFGRFRLDAVSKVFWADEKLVPLPPKEVEILCVLTESGNEVVSKRLLMDRVWQDAFVEESNLSQHIYRLRRTFEEFGESGFIQTVPRRGYRFTVPVETETPADIVIERRSVSSTLVEEVETPTISSLAIFSRPYAVAAVGLLLVFAIGAAFIGYNGFGSPASISSIAVFPVRVIAGDEATGIRAHGLTESLVTHLGSIEGFRVSFYEAELKQPGSQIELVATGRELGVDAVLESVLQQDAGEMRMWLRLLSVNDGRQLWSKTIIEDARNVFRLQDQISHETAMALFRNLDPKALKHPTENSEAFEAYLRGRYLLDKRRSELYEQALVDFRRAVELDPRFAAAYSGIADVYALQANLKTGVLRDELYRASKEYSLKALEIDPNSANAHTSLAWVKRTHEWDWEAAEKHFRLAIDADPNYVTARQWYALLLTSLGRLDEAVIQIEKARELEPLSRSVLTNYVSIAQYRGDLDRLTSLAQKAESLEDDPARQWRVRMLALYRNGQFAEVVEMFRQRTAENGGKMTSDYGAMLAAMSLKKLGRPNEAAPFVENLMKRAADRPEAAYRLAVVEAEFGNYKRAMDLLEHCLRERDDRMVWLKVEPEFAGLRSFPRFTELLAKMRLA
ncbi:MAG: winged helix-turn-helix domain-containing protein [Acidobacteriota bacterium]|nr:MAG: winged helix-turn-helix domain-containing protein [Acidobacteriota bacterium]